MQPAAHEGPRRQLLHDGRQPRQLRRQPLLGPGPARLDHRQGGRDLLAAQGRRRRLTAAYGLAPLAGDVGVVRYIEPELFWALRGSDGYTIHRLRPLKATTTPTRSSQPKGGLAP